MTLDPQAAELLEHIEANDLPLLETLTPVQAREQYEAGAAIVAGRSPAVFNVRQAAAEGPFGAIPLRSYVPHDPAGRALPVLIYFHGGGWVVGSRDSHDAPCRHLASAGNCIVVSVDYRMAPEHPFPEPVQDCWAAVNWIAHNIEQFGGDADRIAIGGDSAGGNLAAVMCLLARDRGGPRLLHQLLIYPATDMTRRFASHDELAEGYRLTRSLMDWFIGNYFSGDNTDLHDPQASPLFADDLGGLPPALIVSAGYDPLRDEDIAYHEGLLDHGVESRHLHYPGMIHGFINMRGFLDAACECLDECGAELQSVFLQQNGAHGTE